MPHMTRVADRQQQEGVTEALQKSGNGWGGGDTNAAAGRQYSHGTRTALSLGPHCPHNPPSCDCARLRKTGGTVSCDSASKRACHRRSVNLLCPPGSSRGS